jgi:hypothetical protein
MLNRVLDGIAGSNYNSVLLVFKDLPLQARDTAAQIKNGRQVLALILHQQESLSH